MAEAFGGKVEKSAFGWRVGLQPYRILARAPWMDAVESFSIPASHQDQVVALPPAARALAQGERGPFGVLGEPVVNALMLTLALDQRAPMRR
jgi:GMP synthase-like glutamine amidotransferase